ncbi:MAG: radical SAM protein [Selenomonadaceae bacterium]|nr:radical SAM protein [Selenomonadaceae bacterium]
MDKNQFKQCILTLTRNCNLRCEFCSAKKGGYHFNAFIKFDDLKKIVKLCNDIKVKYIVLSGGEPLLYPYLMEFLDYIKSMPHKMIPTIATNGILLADYNTCKKIIERGIRYIDVSLKGKDSKEWLAVTKLDGSAQQLRAIANLSDLNVEFTCSMVLTLKNIDTFCETLENARSFGARNFSFTFVIDNEESPEKDLQYLISNDPLLLVDKFIEQIDRVNQITNNEWWIEYSFPLCVYTEKQLTKLNHRLAEPCYIRNDNIFTLEFDTKLNLLPCSMYIDNRVVGKFGVDFSSASELEAYIQSEKYNRIMKEFSQLPSDYCNSCRHKNFCLGGCPWFWTHCSFETFRNFKINKGYD